MPEKIELSRREILAGVGSVGLASVGAGLGTTAYFSDREEFDRNQLTAGELDVKVGWSEHYSDWSADEDGSTTATTDDDVSVWMYPGSGTGSPGELQSGETGLPANDDWLIAVDDPDQFLANTRQEEQDLPADPCTGLDIPDDHDQPVINLADVKPGDFGEVTIDFTLCDNPGYVWLFGDLVAASENGKTEPERDDPDENTSVDPSGLSTDYIELLDAIQAAVWVDDGDNYQDGSESYAVSGSLRDVLAELEAGNGLPLVGDIDAAQAGGTGRDCFSAATATQANDRTHGVVFAWWLPVDHANEIQTDSVTFDLGLYTEQCRHNDGSGLEALPTQPTVFEITEGFDATSGQTFDLETDVGFADPMVTSVDTSTDPVVFTLDVPRDLDKSAGDQWSLVLDADNDGTVDFRIVYDDFFYQEWDDGAGDWGPEQPVPEDVDAGIIDGIYLVRVPRDRLSDPFAFAGRLCYGGAAPTGEDLCISFTPEFNPADAFESNTGDFQKIALGDVSGACCLSGDGVPEMHRNTCVEITADSKTQAIKKCNDICKDLGGGAGDCSFEVGKPCHDKKPKPRVRNISEEENCGDGDCCARLDFDVRSEVPIRGVAIRARECKKAAKGIINYRTEKKGQKLVKDKTSFSLSEIAETLPCLEKCQEVQILVVPERNTCPGRSRVLVSERFGFEDCGACCIAIRKQDGGDIECVLSVSKECCERFGEGRDDVKAVWKGSGTNCKDDPNDDNDTAEICEGAFGQDEEAG